MCWERYEKRELIEQERVREEEARRLEAETEEQALEGAPAEEDERELVPA